MSVENNVNIDMDSVRMRLEAVTFCLAGLLGTALGQVRWGSQDQAGQGGGGGFNPGAEFPALGEPSSNPGVACRNETTGIFGPCTGKIIFTFIFLSIIGLTYMMKQLLYRPRYRATIKHRIPGWCE